MNCELHGRRRCHKARCSVALNHHDVVKRCQLKGQGGIDLTQENRIHGLDDVDHGQVHAGEGRKVGIVNFDAIRETDAGGAGIGLKAVVDSVAVLVERRALPPRCVVVQPCRLGLFWNFKAVACGHPLEAFPVNGLPARRLRFDHQRTGDRPHQQREHQDCKHPTHVLPRATLTAGWAST